MPAPKPWCGGRCWVMSNAGSGKGPRIGAGRVREHLHDAALRDVQTLELDVLDGLAGHPGDGRVDPHHLLDGVAAELGPLAQQRATGRGAASRVCRARPSWLRVVSIPAKARKTSATDELAVGQLLGRCTSVVTRSSRGCARRSATTSSTYAVSPASAASIRGTWLPTSIENDAPRSSAQCATWRPVVLAAARAAGR